MKNDGAKKCTRGAEHWLALVARPCSGDPGGEDPRYSDDFVQIKQEIDKLKGNDFVLVRSTCRDLIASSSKDLRLAGYQLYAAAYLEGVAGILEGCHAYRILLEQFWGDCHPRREAARSAALGWLNNPRLETFLRQHGAAVPKTVLEDLRSEIDQINRLVCAYLGEGALTWTALDGWLEKNLAARASRNCEKVGSNAAAHAPATNHPQEFVHSLCGGAAVTSEHDLHATTRAVRAYLVGRGELLQAAAYTRALRWGALRLPPSEEGRTRIPAPRASAAGELQQVCGQGDSHATLDLCERLFLEPGGHLWLDLQHIAQDAAQAAQRKDLAEFLADQTASLARRLPGLVKLSFEDGSPFAGPETRGWIAGLTREPPAASADCKGQDSWQASLDEAVAEAHSLAGQNKLGEALHLLGSLACGGARERMRMQLAQSALCLQAGRAEVALPLLEKLEEDAHSKSLALWDEKLVLEIWRQAFEAARACARIAGDDRPGLEQKARRLHELICRTDPAAAVHWF